MEPIRAVPRRVAGGLRELWADDGEAEVELARLIVAPGKRGQGVSRGLAAMLADVARSKYPRVFLRIHPGNIATQRCYPRLASSPSARPGGGLKRRPAGRVPLAQRCHLTSA